MPDLSLPLSDPEADAKLRKLLEGGGLIPDDVHVVLQYKTPTTIEITPAQDRFVPHMLVGLTSQNTREDQITIEQLEGCHGTILREKDVALFNVGHIVPLDGELVSALAPLLMTLRRDNAEIVELKTTIWTKKVKEFELQSRSAWGLPTNSAPDGMSDHEMNLVLALRELKNMVDRFKGLDVGVENKEVQALLDRYAKIL